MQVGICTTTEGDDQSPDLLDLDAPVSRFVLTTRDARTKRLPQWHGDLGQIAHGVVAKETFQAFGLDPYRDFDAVFRRVRNQWGDQVSILEPGNESDDTGGSSYGMTPKQFEALCWSACKILHVGQHERPMLISGGVNTGQPGYFQGVTLPPCMWFGIHSYDKSILGWPFPGWGYGPVADYVDVYKFMWQRMRGVALTETGTTSQDQRFVSEYLRRFFDWANYRPEIFLVEWFCMYNRQHPPHGLIDGTTRRQQFGEMKHWTATHPPKPQIDYRKFAYAGGHR